MSILIKDMEMPKGCNVCPFSIFKICLINTLQEGKHTVTHSCPLVEVPTPHGRLIDENWLRGAMITTLEALKKNPKMDGQEMHLIAAFDTLRVMIEDAPTIIGAEEDE